MAHGGGGGSGKVAHRLGGGGGGLGQVAYDGGQVRWFLVPGVCRSAHGPGEGVRSGVSWSKVG